MGPHHNDTPQGCRYGDEEGGALVHLSGPPCWSRHLHHVLQADMQGKAGGGKS
jgi:hypothetical protein